MLDKETRIADANAVHDEAAFSLQMLKAPAPTVQIKKRRRILALPADNATDAPSEANDKQDGPPAAEPAEGLSEQFTQAVLRLAGLSAVEFERCRKTEADALGVRVAMLSDHVERARREAALHQQAQQHALTLLSGAVTATAGRKTMEFGNGRYEVSDKDGVWFVSLDAETGAERRTWISSTLHIVARTRDENSVSWGVLLRWKDPSGVQHEMALPTQMLQTDGADMRRALADQGLTIAANQSGRQHLQTYMLVWNPGRFARCVHRMGWHGDLFVMPGVEYAQAEEITVFQNVHAVDPAFATAGTLDDWKGRVAALAVGNSRLMFAISTAFAGALLECSGSDSGGFHFRGASSTGKSTAQLVAASVWGHPGKYKRSWRFTANGLEGIAALLNDGILILDELSECPPREAGEAVYMLANGQGKGRATKTGAARQAQSWRLVFLSSGEESLASVMAKSGQQVKAGQEIRLVEIDADASQGMGLFAQLNGAASPAALAQELKNACGQFHGAAGQQWLAYLVQQRPTLAAHVKASMDAFVATQAPAEASGQVMRVARRFALVACAGELATAAGLTGWETGKATQAAVQCFFNWIGNFGGAGNREDRALLEQVRAFFETHGSSRFEDMSARHEQRVVNRAGFYRKDGGGEREYLVLPETFKREVCEGFDPRHAGKVLGAAGWLKAGSNGRVTRTERLPGMGDKTRCYVFTSALWNGSGHDH
jgi:putative DNA primase/helicase